MAEHFYIDLVMFCCICIKVLRNNSMWYASNDSQLTKSRDISRRPEY